MFEKTDWPVIEMPEIKEMPKTEKMEMMIEKMNLEQKETAMKVEEVLSAEPETAEAKKKAAEKILIERQPVGQKNPGKKYYSASEQLFLFPIQFCHGRISTGKAA